LPSTLKGINAGDARRGLEAVYVVRLQADNKIDSVFMPFRVPVNAYDGFIFLQIGYILKFWQPVSPLPAGSLQ
jgi:hypothetical protein